MIDKLSKYKHLISRASFVLIDVIFAETNSYNILFVTKRGDELFLGDFTLDLDFENVFKKVNKSLPILLHFSGKGIISKKISSKNNYLKEILFNAHPSDFYVYELNYKDTNFVSVIRRDVINKVFEDFKEAGFIVVDYSLGPFVGALYKNVSKEKYFFSQNCQLNFLDEELTDFQVNPAIVNESYPFGEGTINNYQIPLFSSLINYLYPNDNISYDRSYIKTNKLELRSRRVFNFLGVSVLAFFLISLLSSYMIIDYYNGKYLDYEEQLFYLNDTFNNVKKLESDIVEKKAIINESGVLSEKFITFYLYEIGKSVPSDVTISNFIFNPIENKIKKGESLKINKKSIKISGVAASSLTMNDWVKKLKNNDWIENIEIVNFNKNRNNDLLFDLAIKYK